jgi:hypothetical protein
VQLNSESLKNALVYFLAECDLSFCLIERKSFCELVHLINEDAAPLVRQMCRSGIATHLARVYLQSQETIKVEYLAKQETICFTQDAWTAPNCTAFMGVTSHFIDEKFRMRDLTLAVPHIQGKFSMFLHFIIKGDIECVLTCCFQEVTLAKCLRISFTMFLRDTGVLAR